MNDEKVVSSNGIHRLMPSVEIVCNHPAKNSYIEELDDCCLENFDKRLRLTGTADRGDATIPRSM